MNRKILIYLPAAVVLMAASMVDAQQPAKLPRIGYLTGASSSRTTFTDAFRQGLHDLGYVEAKNVVIEYRYAEGNFERLPALAADLVSLKVDVIFASSTPAVQAAKKATTAVPIVSISGNPVQAGFVSSLARPGGNITGLATFSVDLAEKRLELLKETFPKVSRVAVLWNPDTPLETRPEEMQVMARRLGMELQISKVRAPDPDLPRAFQAAITWRADALAVMQVAFFSANQQPILDFATKNRVPVIYTDRIFVEGGGLMSYGTSVADMFRRAATYVNKILKGAKPADLPVERPTKFELIINLKAAKELGVTIPSSVLYRADEIIK